VFHEKIQPGTLISLMLYTLNLAMCFAFLSNVYGEFMQVGVAKCIWGVHAGGCGKMYMGSSCRWVWQNVYGEFM
jgi:hypothetical protein